jgi:hypothetical protein
MRVLLVNTEFERIWEEMAMAQMEIPAWHLPLTD